MIVKNQYFIVFVILLSLFIDNSEAGWKFWKKETTTTTTTTETPINVQSTANPTPDSANNKPQVTTAKGPTVLPVNTGAAILGSGNPGLAIGAGTTGQDVRNNARPNRPNPGTEVGLDIVVPKPNRPGVSSGQNYRDWAVDFTGAGEPSQNQPSGKPAQGPTINTGGQVQPNVPNVPSAGGSRLHPETTNRPAGSSTPGNIAVQPTPPSTVGPRPGSVSQQSPSQSAGIGTPSRPTLQPFHPVQPHVTPGSTISGDRNRPDTPSSPNSSGKSWADVVAGPGSRPSSPTGSPRQSEFPRQPIAGSNSADAAAVAGQNRPSTPSSPNSGNSWPGANAGGSRPSSPIGLPKQPEYPRQPGGNELRTTERPTQPGNSRSALPGDISAGGSASATGATDSTKTTYSSNPTYSKGNTVTDEDLEKLSEALYIKETNNANRYITLNVQKKTTSSSSVDQAPQPLLTVSPEAFQIPTIQKVISIFDNYQLDTRTNEYISPAQRQEESLLVDTFLSTSVMSAAMRFLANKGFVKQDYYDYKDTLRRIWFNLFSRGQGKIGSSGFEHVFMAETRQADSITEVLGLHNWIYFNAEEEKRHIDYLGYINKIDLGSKGSIVKMHAKFNGNDKPVTAMFVGTSPELEMALYTVCFYARPDEKCPVSLGGTKFNIMTYKFKYRGKDLIGTAYPEI